MTPQPFDYHKPFTTRSGLKAELLCDDLNEPYPLGVKLTLANGEKHFSIFTKKGCRNAIGNESTFDLINIPERIQRTVAINFYPNPDDDSIWKCRDEADKVAMPDRLACKEVTFEFEVGEGL